MSRVYKEKEYEVLRIRPEGWVNDLVFELSYFSSGQAKLGMGIRINDEAGGVLTNDDMVAIAGAIGEHFNKLKNDIDEATSEAPTKERKE